MPEVNTFAILPAQSSPFYAVEVTRAYGLAEVRWPSGRRTLEQYAANVVTTDAEREFARNSDVLRLAKRANLEASMLEFQHNTYRRGYFIRTKRRRKARKVESLTWIHPNEYTGPAPMRGGLLPDAS